MEQMTVMTSAQLLDHWQEHRRLTRRTILAFPETDFSSTQLVECDHLHI